MTEMTDQPILVGLLNALLIILPIMVTFRVGVNMLIIACDSEKKEQYARRTKNVLKFLAFAECSVGIAKIFIRYFS